MVPAQEHSLSFLVHAMEKPPATVKVYTPFFAKEKVEEFICIKTKLGHQTSMINDQTEEFIFKSFVRIDLCEWE